MTDPLDAALLAAWNAAEPEGPECHLCGNLCGPWTPDPSGDRWPSGAQKLVCASCCAPAEGLPREVGQIDPPAEVQGADGKTYTPRPAQSGADLIVGDGWTPEPKQKRRPPLSVRVDERLAGDLAAMARAGLNPSDAVRTALAIVADAYRYAWSQGVVPEGVQPAITGCAVLRYDAGMAVPPGA